MHTTRDEEVLAMSDTATATTAINQQHWMLTPLFMLRIGGMPIDVVAPLRNPGTVRWARDLLDTEAALDAAKDGIGDALQAVIADNADEQRRRQLLELRRSVFNRRMPKNAATARELAADLDEPAARSLTEWLDRRAQYEQLLGAGDAVLAGETELARKQLRDLARDPRLRHGLLLSSPSLDRYLPTYLNGEDGKLNKRARRIERSVLEYVYRTACKTSPFSTMTVVALGRFAADAGAVLPAARLDGEWRSHPRLNIATLARLAGAIADDPGHRADLPVRLTSGLQSDKLRVRYVRRVWSTGDDEAAVSLDSLQENLFYLTQGTVLQEVIDILNEAVELPFGVLADRLRAVDPDNRSVEDVDAYLRQLLRLSLLVVPSLRIDIHSADPVRAFRDGLRLLDQPWSRDTADGIDGVADLVDAYPAADLDRRRSLLNDIRGRLEQAQTGLGIAEPSTPRTLVYEDVSLPDADAVADTDGWQRSMLPALRQVARLLPVFDMTLPQRLSLKGFFVARYGVGGRCDDVLRFVHEFHRDYYDQYLKVHAQRATFDENGEFVPDQNWLRVPEVDALGQARQELIRRMAAVAGRDDEVVLDDEFVDAVGSLVPQGLLDFEPRSFFLQVADVDGRPLGVINRSYSGLTLMFSRFLHCFDDTRLGGLAAELRAELTRLQPEGAVFAEVTGGYDTTNLNLHPAVTAYELVCPGDVSFRPAAEQLTIDDLSVIHDEGTDRLRLHSWSLDKEVIPVYLGFLVPLALPEVQRAMLLFSRTSLARIDLWGGTGGPPQTEPSADGTIRVSPRVRYGDVVVARRRWTVHPDQLPVRGPGDTDATAFLGWQRWRHRHGLPARVFASLDPAPLDPDAETGDVVTIKPQYVDFDSAFSLNLLEHSVHNGNRLVLLEEMLPDTDQVWLRSDGGRHVTEQTIEITGTTRPLSGPDQGTT